MQLLQLLQLLQHMDPSTHGLTRLRHAARSRTIEASTALSLRRNILERWLVTQQSGHDERGYLDPPSHPNLAILPLSSHRANSGTH